MLLKLWRHFFFFLTEDIFKAGFITQGYFNYKLLSHLHSIVMISHLCLCPEANKEESSFVSKIKESMLTWMWWKRVTLLWGCGPSSAFSFFWFLSPPLPGSSTLICYVHAKKNNLHTSLHSISMALLPSFMFLCSL